MRDCENVEVREALPDLIHDRLPAAERERVLAHVQGCAECAAELELLRGVRGAVRTSAPAVDAAAIARAVRARLAEPAPSAERAAAPVRSGRRGVFGDWRLRIAAALVLMAGGAAGVLVARGGRDVPASPRADTVALAESPASAAPAPAPAPLPVARESVPASRPAPRPSARPAPAVALGSSFSDLSDDELAAILEAVTGKDAKLPVADPGAAPDLVGVEGSL